MAPTPLKYDNNEGGPNDKGWRVKFSPEINLGAVIQSLVVIGSFFIAGAAYVNKIDDAVTDIKALRSDVNARFEKFQKDTSDQIIQIRQDNSKQFNEVRADIVNMPDVKASLVQLERRQGVTETDARYLNTKIDQLNNVVIQTRSDLDNIVRSSPQTTSSPRSR